MNAAWVMAIKDLRLLARDRAALFWILAFPAIFALFLGSIMQAWSARDDVRLTLAIVDGDRSPASLAYLAQLARHPSLRTREQPLADAQRELQRGEVDALVRVLPTFGASPDWYAGGKEVLRIESDPSRRREAQYLQGLLLEQGLKDAIELELTSDPRTAVRVVASEALRVAPTPYELVTPMAVLWGLIGCAAAFAISIAGERQHGMLRRLATLPLGATQILLGKALACWTACMAVAGLILLAATLVFDVRLTSPLALALSVAALGLCFTGLMAAISTFGRSERSVAGAGWATLLFLAMIGGVMAPRMIMPEWLRAFGAWSPVHWGVVALEGALWRGGATLVLAPCAALAALGTCGLLLGAWVLQRSAP